MRKLKVNFLNRSRIDLNAKYLTEDNLIDVAQKQFFKQEEQLINLKNHLRLFINGIMNVTDTMDNMYSCFQGIYEPNWVGNIDFNRICQESIKILRQFIADFKCNISKTVNEYERDFPEMKKSIDKRSKKLVELNKQRKIYESYRNQKKIDASKLDKAKLDLDRVDQEYKIKNNALKDTLPKFCDKRIRVYSDLWSKLFEAEGAMFAFLHESRNNQLSVLSKLSDLADSDQYSIKAQINLGNDYDTNLLSTKAYAKSAMSLFSADYQSSETQALEPKSSSYAFVPTTNSFNVAKNVPDNSTLNKSNNYRFNEIPSPVMSDISRTSFFSLSSEKQAMAKKISFTNNSQVTIKSNKSVVKNNHKYEQYSLKGLPDSSDVDDGGSDNDLYSTIEKSQNQFSIINGRNENRNSFEDSRTSLKYDTIINNRYYYQVLATFDYHGQDDDELSLCKDDIILVLPWTSEEHMEEGWLFGEKIVTKQKGLFPENHTMPFDS